VKMKCYVGIGNKHFRMAYRKKNHRDRERRIGMKGVYGKGGRRWGTDSNAGTKYNELRRGRGNVQNGMKLDRIGRADRKRYAIGKVKGDRLGELQECGGVKTSGKWEGR